MRQLRDALRNRSATDFPSLRRLVDYAVSQGFQGEKLAEAKDIIAHIDEQAARCASFACVLHEPFW